MTLIKLFYSTDWHAKGKSPSSRTDDFPSTIEQKIEEFFDAGMDHGADAFVVGGDFVDTSYLSPQYVVRLGALIQRKLQQYDRNLYYILGNHDVIAYTPTSITSTAFGVFLHFEKRMIHLSRKPTIIQKGSQAIALTGVDSYAYMDKEWYEGDRLIKANFEDWVVPVVNHPTIHIAHGFLSPKPILEDIPHTVIADMKHTKAIVTLGSHDHTGFGVTKLDYGLAYNPGALGRVFASHAEMERMPFFALVTIHQDGTPDIQPIRVQCAKAGHLVMDRTALDEKKAKQQLLLRAKENITGALSNINVGSLDLRMLVSDMKHSVSPAAYQETLKRLEL